VLRCASADSSVIEFIQWSFCTEIHSVCFQPSRAINGVPTPTLTLQLSHRWGL